MIRCLLRYSADAGTSSCLWSFNPLLLRLLGEISPSLPCSHSFWGSALDLDPPLRVGRLRASVPRPDRTGLKEQLLRGLWLTQAAGRERYGGGGASLKKGILDATETVIKAQTTSYEENAYMAKNLHLNTILGIHTPFQEVHKPEIKNT